MKSQIQLHPTSVHIPFVINVSWNGQEIIMCVLSVGSNLINFWDIIHLFKKEGEVAIRDNRRVNLKGKDNINMISIIQLPFYLNELISEIKWPKKRKKLFSSKIIFLGLSVDHLQGNKKGKRTMSIVCCSKLLVRNIRFLKWMIFDRGNSY